MKNSNLTNNSLLLSFGTILNKVLQFVMVILFSSWLTTEDYGKFDLIWTYVLLLIPIVTLSLSNAVFRFSVDSEERDKYITNGFMMTTINIIILSIILLILKIVFNWSLIIPFLLLCIGEIFNNYFRGYMRGIKKLNVYSLCMALSTIFILIFSFFFIQIFNFNLEGLIYGYALGYIVTNIIIIIVTKFWNYFNIKTLNKSIIKDMFKYSYPLVFNDVSWWIVNASDRVIINVFLGELFNGIYAIAYKIPNLCTSIFNVFNIAWQEKAVEIKDMKEKNNYYNNVYNKIILILISLCLGILACNFILFDYIFDSKYIDAHLYTPFLVTSVIFNMISLFYGSIQISLKRTKSNAITTIIGSVINVLINLSLIKFVGLYSAAISTLISTVFVCIMRKYLLRKEINVFIMKKNFIYIILYVYVGVASYFYIELPFLLNIFNLLLAISLFIIINKCLLFKYLKKLLKKRNKV